MSGTIRIRRAGDAVWLTLEHPARRNAMTLRMWRELATHCRAVAGDDTARALVLQGHSDKAFCAGADISEFTEQRSDRAAVAAYDEAVRAASDALMALPIPTLAMVRGVCYGGGFGLAMTCDVRLASDDARFRVPAGRLGLGYPMASVRLLVDRLGPAATADLLYSARVVGASEALACGIVQGVWPAPEFETAARGYVESIAGNAPLTLRAVKAALVELSKPDAERAPRAVERAVEACFESEDYREGQRAFLEKRRPGFKGR